MRDTHDAAPVGPTAQCAFCGYPIPEDPVAAPGPAQFCSAACREAFADDDQPFAGRHGYKYPRTGVAVLDRLLPQGYRADSLVLLRGEAGSRRGELQLELAWRALRRGEPVVLVSFVDPPTAVIERFLSVGWNVLPDLEAGRLHVIDCFTRRLTDPDQFDTDRSAWTDYVAGFLEDATTTMRSPDDVLELEGRLNSVVEDLEMSETGLVVIDSLEEIGTLVSDAQVENFLKEVRAEICKNRFVPIVASRCTDRSMSPHGQQVRLTGGGLTTDLTYFVDGIVDFRINEGIVPDTRLKQVSVRKMRGVRFVPQWLTYEFGQDGLVPFDPRTETRSVYDPDALAAGAPPGAGTDGRPPQAAEPGGQPAGPGQPAQPGPAPVPTAARQNPAPGRQPAPVARAPPADAPSAGAQTADEAETDDAPAQTTASARGVWDS